MSLQNVIQLIKQFLRPFSEEQIGGQTNKPTCYHAASMAKNKHKP